MMLIYDSFRAVIDCFLANNDRRVAKISTPTNFDIVVLIFLFQIDIVTQYAFSPLHDDIMGRCQITEQEYKFMSKALLRI